MTAAETGIAVRTLGPFGSLAAFLPRESPLGVLAMAAPANAQVSPLVQFAPWVAMAAIFYFIVWLPMRRRQKKVQAFLENLKVGDRIVTTSGIYGLITKLGDKSVQLQIADKVRIEVARSAVGGYQGQEPVVQDTTAN